MVIVMTGATSGIGAVAAQRLAAAGARIVFVARDRDRAARTLARLREIAPQSEHRAHYADLSRIEEMTRVGKEIAASEPRIDVLINNAGAMFTRREVTPDGFELTFATNHLSYFIITQELRASLEAAGNARIVNTASEAHRGAKLDFGDLQCEKNYSGFNAYRRSKLCNVLFSRELARQLRGTSITTNSLHPGFVNTRFGDNNTGAFASVFRLAKKFAITPEKGAETIVYLATSKDVATTTGLYFDKCRPRTPSNEGQDDVAAERLWAETLHLLSRRS